MTHKEREIAELREHIDQSFSTSKIEPAAVWQAAIVVKILIFVWMLLSGIAVGHLLLNISIVNLVLSGIITWSVLRVWHKAKLLVEYMRYAHEQGYI